MRKPKQQRRTVAIFAPHLSQKKEVVRYLCGLSHKYPGTKVYICPKEVWKDVVFPDLPDQHAFLGKPKDCKYEDGHLVSFARSIWNSTHVVVFNDLSKVARDVTEMSFRMSGIRKIKVIQT